ncbi:MAG: response regulator, partial [Flammeovirgaceae bacterium]|nr:response regulator [Flammeovirgaceae bacterium]
MADKINCLIVEDDLIQREVILGYVKRIPDLHVVASCSSALEANTYLSSSSVSLLFSDIEMEDISGL